MVLKKIKVEIWLSEEAVKYLRTKFEPDEVEKIAAFFEDFVRLEMKIDQVKPKVRETSEYRLMRRKVEQLNNEGKDITAEALATCARVKINVAREWLHRMEEDGFIEMNDRDSRHRKHFKWIGYGQTSK
jgi:ribosomal protein S25